MFVLIKEFNLLMRVTVTTKYVLSLNTYYKETYSLYNIQYFFLSLSITAYWNYSLAARYLFAWSLARIGLDQ